MSLPLMSVKYPYPEKVLSCISQPFNSQKNNLELRTWSSFKFYSKERETILMCVQGSAYHEIIFSSVDIDFHYS